MKNSTLLPSLFISHGGGPWSYMEGEFRDNYKELELSLRQIPSLLKEKPKAVLIISAHWQTNVIAVSGHPQPPMIYDYSGFPEETYRISYPAHGSLKLAQQVQNLITKAGIDCEVDPDRGFDHGTFVPMSVIYPAADIPLVQLSIHSDSDPAFHLSLGRALAPLKSEGILIIGSGLSYHNLGNFGPAAKQISKEFDDWLQRTICHTTSNERNDRLIHWEQAPSARQAHPQEDHLLPLLVAVGTAENEVASCIYHEENFIGGLSVSGFQFG